MLELLHSAVFQQIKLMTFTSRDEATVMMLSEPAADSHDLRFIWGFDNCNFSM